MSRRKTEDLLGKALDLWQAPADAGEPLVCIATSFTFDATFFEMECIGRFLQMNSHPLESESVGYMIERDEKLAGAKVCALVDRRHARDKESLRWDVLGVIVPKGIQHAKVSLLMWANHARVIIGSGNLSQPGYRSNLEVFGTVDFSKTSGGPRISIERTVSFLRSVLDLAVGNAEPNTPKARAREGLSLVARRMADWPDSQARVREIVPLFGSPNENIFSQLAEARMGGPPRTASVVSPFFDRPDGEQGAITGLLGVMSKKRPRSVCFAVRTDELPDGRTRVYAPRSMIQKCSDACDVYVYPILHAQYDEVRELHAKILRLDSDEWRMLLVGSSNFTRAGLSAGNLEANLLYVAKESEPEFALLGQIWPQTSEQEIDVDSPALIWNPESEDLEDGVSDIPLPDAFQDAIFFPGENAQLKIVLTPDLPSQWSIRVPNGFEILGSKTGSPPGEHLCPWGQQPTPFVLDVTWTYGSQCAVAAWPVNVSNPSELPPPDSLRDLSLEQLLEILSSTRPLSEAVTQALRRRKKGINSTLELDPLRRFDSPAHLLRRTKRVSMALERLRDQLERPVLTLEAFQWRLSGAIGPITLANAFVREATLPGEAKFYLAELALALSRVRPDRSAEGGLLKETISEQITSVVNKIMQRAERLPSTDDTAMLDEYARAAFAKATSI